MCCINAYIKTRSYIYLLHPSSGYDKFDRFCITVYSFAVTLDSKSVSIVFFGFCPQVTEENEDIRGRRAIKETELREQVRAENVGGAFRDGVHSAKHLLLTLKKFFSAG